ECSESQSFAQETLQVAFTVGGAVDEDHGRSVGHALEEVEQPESAACGGGVNGPVNGGGDIDDDGVELETSGEVDGFAAGVGEVCGDALRPEEPGKLDGPVLLGGVGPLLGEQDVEPRPPVGGGVRFAGLWPYVDHGDIPDGKAGAGGRGGGGGGRPGVNVCFAGVYGDWWIAWRRGGMGAGCQR